MALKFHYSVSSTQCDLAQDYDVESRGIVVYTNLDDVPLWANFPLQVYPRLEFQVEPYQKVHRPCSQHCKQDAGSYSPSNAHLGQWIWHGDEHKTNLNIK
jgi:hypothetical protein